MHSCRPLPSLQSPYIAYCVAGTGKTHIAQCCAVEARSQGHNVTLIAPSISDIGSAYNSHSEQLVALVYEVAKEHQPAIVFWDEVDKLFPKDGDNNDTYGQRSVAALQTAMNGFHSGGDVLTIGATNYPSKIAPAVLSRLSLKFFCGMPDASGCSQIAQRCFLRQGTRPIPCEDGIDWDDIGRRLNGLSGRDIDRVVVPRARSIVQRAMKEATYFHRVG
eukprot:COSAG06_NODE_12712_length_1339_cov_16.456452_2_plen_218_part_01